MYYREDFYRNEALGSEQRSLPASTYNDMRLLLQRHEDSSLFVPVRALQYMAVVDNEEIIFVDIHMRRVIEFSWRGFRPQQREGLTCPVDYHFAWYNKKARATMDRMPVEFAKAVRLMLNRKREKESLATGDLLAFPPGPVRRPPK